MDGLWFGEFPETLPVSGKGTTHWNMSDGILIKRPWWLSIRCSTEEQLVSFYWLSSISLKVNTISWFKHKLKKKEGREETEKCSGISNCGHYHFVVLVIVGESWTLYSCCDIPSTGIEIKCELLWLRVPPIYWTVSILIFLTRERKIGRYSWPSHTDKGWHWSRGLTMKDS